MKLKISKLMDEYTDTEFFPTGGSTADPEAVKERVLANVKHDNRKSTSKMKKVLFAAALAAALVLLVGAGLPYIQYQLVGGTLTFEQTTNGRITALVENTELVSYEDGRLIFTQNDGHRIDITDLVSEETPYIYNGSDPDTGLVNYIIIGGTPESFGWFEWVQTSDPFDDGLCANVDENGNSVRTAFIFRLSNPENDRISVGGFDTVPWDDAMDHPWLLSGMDQLGISFDEPEPVSDSSYILQ